MCYIFLKNAFCTINNTVQNTQKNIRFYIDITYYLRYNVNMEQEVMSVYQLK